VKRAAADVGGIGDFDAQYQKVLQSVRTDAAIGSALGVDSTPSFFVNGKRVPSGGLPPQYFEALIELELKRATK
jgi:protein-disulfide isomerase